MAYKSHVKASTLKASGGGRGSSSKGGDVNTYGRVVHVVLSKDDPYYKSADMINGVYYRTPNLSGQEVDITTFPFAYQGSAQNRTIPLPGEIVTLFTGANTNSLTNPGSTKTYWKESVNLWNHPHHNAAPDTLQSDWQDNLLKGFPAQKTINPLVANPGDTLLEGRLGQSIRFGGSKGSSTIIDSSNNGKPVILISNGQITTQNGSDLIQEDINDDFNSLYFLSDHKVPLTAANTKRDSYTEIPTTADQYKGNQVVINGGRLYFNAKEESVLISAKNSIGLNAKTLNFDAEDYICLDATKIFIGKKARTAFFTKEPAVLGVQLQNWLGELLAALSTVAFAMETASATGAGPVTQLNSAGPVLRSSVESLRTQYELFKSKKVFIE